MTISFSLGANSDILRAQSDTLAYGERVRGFMENEPQVWFFEGRADDVVVIDMLTLPNSGLDGVLRLYGVDGEMLLEDDDGGHNTNPRIGPVRLPADGRYEISVSAYSGRGEYILQLTGIENMVTLALEKSLTLTLDDEHMAAHLWLENVPPGILRLEALPENDSAPLISIFNSDGTVMNQSAYRKPGVIEPFIVQGGEQYIIILDMAFPQRDTAQTVHFRLMPSTIELLTAGSVVEGRVSTTGAPVHFFEARSGEQVTLEVRLLDGEISPSIYIRSVNGEHFLFSSSAVTVLQTIVTLRIPADGLYSIEISDGSYSGESGHYRLHFDSP